MEGSCLTLPIAPEYYTKLDIGDLAGELSLASKRVVFERVLQHLPSQRHNVQELIIQHSIIVPDIILG